MVVVIGEVGVPGTTRDPKVAGEVIEEEGGGTRGGTVRKISRVKVFRTTIISKISMTTVRIRTKERREREL